MTVVKKLQLKSQSQIIIIDEFTFMNGVYNFRFNIGQLRLAISTLEIISPSLRLTARFSKSKYTLYSFSKALHTFDLKSSDDREFSLLLFALDLF